MGKLEKYGEQAIGYYPKKKERKRRRTKEEKQLVIKKFNELVERNKRMHTSPMLLSKEEKIRDKEWERQERKLCVHSETFEKNGVLICRLCGEELKDLRVKKGFQEKFMDLFCPHKNLEEFDDNHEICLKCGAKFKKREM